MAIDIHKSHGAEGFLLGLFVDDAVLLEHCGRAAVAAGWGCVRDDERDGAAATAALLIVTPDRLATLAPFVSPTTVVVTVGAAEPCDRADETIGIGVEEAGIAALLARWLPRPLAAATRRQVETFGVAAMMPLLDSLRDRLAQALSGGSNDARAAAHRLAGLAGLLGFAEVAATWEAFFSDGEPARIAARQAARRALATLDRSDLSHRIG